MPENKYNKSQPKSFKWIYILLSNNICGTATHEKQILQRHILSSRTTREPQIPKPKRQWKKETREKEIQSMAMFGVSLKIIIAQRHHELSCLWFILQKPIKNETPIFRDVFSWKMLTHLRDFFIKMTLSRKMKKAQIVFVFLRLVEPLNFPNICAKTPTRQLHAINDCETWFN